MNINLKRIFKIYWSNSHLVFYIFGIKFSFLYYGIKQLRFCCHIENLDHIKEQRTIITHPIGIVIHDRVRLGKNCMIRQNVTIGRGSYKEATKREYPIIGSNVQFGAGAIVIGGINVGDNAIIGAGAIVTKDVPENAVVVGNPARVIKYIK